MTISAAAMFRLRQGDKVQAALPDMSPDGREFIISGGSPEGWAETFGSQL